MPPLPPVELGLGDWIFPLLIAFFVLRNILKAMKKAGMRVQPSARAPRPIRGTGAKRARPVAVPVETVSAPRPRVTLDTAPRALDRPSAIERADNGFFGATPGQSVPPATLSLDDRGFADSRWRDAPSAGHFATADDPNFTAHRFSSGDTAAFAFHDASEEARPGDRPAPTRTVKPPSAPVTATESVRAMLRSPAGLRQAFVLGEILTRRR